MPQPRKKQQQDGPTIMVKGREYLVNQDFTWRELITVEELSGMPLGRDDSLDHMLVGAAFIFVILKREDKELMWDAFIDQPLSDVSQDEQASNGHAPATRRPTKAAKAASNRSA